MSPHFGCSFTSTAVDMQFASTSVCR